MIKKALTFILFSLLIALASLLWLNEADLKDSTYRLPFSNVVAGYTVPPLVTTPIINELRYWSTQSDVDNEGLLELSKLYIERKPLDPEGWLFASLYAKRLDDIVSAVEYLNVAHSLSKNNLFFLAKVFNEYLELDLIQQAMDVARDLVEAKPIEFRRIFYLMTRLNTNYVEVVDLVIPKLEYSTIFKNNKKFKAGAYYSWALIDAIRADNKLLAEAIWEAAPAKFKEFSDDGVRYLDFISRSQESSEVKLVWGEITGQELVPLRIGGLPLNNQNISPCWFSRKADGVRLEILDEVEDQVLSLTFDGSGNLFYAHSTCLALVDTDSDYTLSFKWKGKEVTTRSGPFVDIIFPGVDGVVARSSHEIGNWSLKESSFDFTVPKGIELIKLRIRRSKSGFLDSKIAGSVQFSDFKLIKLSASE